jgi:hypothetical protein
MSARVLVTFSAKVQIDRRLNVVNSMHPVASVAALYWIHGTFRQLSACTRIFCF